MLEVFRVPFSRVVPWFGPSAAAVPDLKPFPHENPILADDDGFLLGCVKYANNVDSRNQPCVLYLHGFPDQAVDHRQELLERYGQFSTRMTKKFAEAFDSFAAINFSGSPGSSTIQFCDKTVSQEIWDVLNTMSYLSHEKQIGTAGFHIVGLSTGAIMGAVLRGLSQDHFQALDIPPIRSITIIAACGSTSMETALGFDFDEEQLSDFDVNGHCTKQFWLPIGSESNPKDAILMSDNDNNDADAAKTETLTQSVETKWCPHALRLKASYRNDFLQLPIKEHLEIENSIPLLCIHGAMDKNIPVEEGRAVFESAAEPKKYFELPKANHLLTNSKDMKKAISEIKKWHQSNMS